MFTRVECLKLHALFKSEGLVMVEDVRVLTLSLIYFNLIICMPVFPVDRILSTQIQLAADRLRYHKMFWSVYAHSY